MRRALIVANVVIATIAGGVSALATFRLESDLDIGTTLLSIDPGHRGALDLHVPLVDWGVRFPVVRLPVRVKMDVRAVNRSAVVALAQSGRLDPSVVRAQARKALSSYLRLAILAAMSSGLAFGLLVAVAVRGGGGPRLRTTLSVALGTSLVLGLVLVVLLPPRSRDAPAEYYANGPEVPVALRTLEAFGASAKTLDEEIDEQLLGIARFVNEPASRPTLTSNLPRLTVASDLHNNVIALPALERAARGSLLLFSGDLTDRGATLEQSLVPRIAGAGTRMVFVSGNHDSDVMERKLAQAGVIVLTRRGRLRSDGSTDANIVTHVAGLRIAGYDDPHKRLVRTHYRDNDDVYTRAEQNRFAAWLKRVVGAVDIVMVHAPALARRGLEALRRRRHNDPLLLVEGHTHTQSLERLGTVSVLNSGSAGGGGTGNLTEAGGAIGLARLTYTRLPSFVARAADLVRIDPGDGEAQARRYRLDDTPAKPQP